MAPRRCQLAPLFPYLVCFLQGCQLAPLFAFHDTLEGVECHPFHAQSAFQLFLLLSLHLLLQLRLSLLLSFTTK